MDEHILHVRQVLQRLLENKLYVKAEKCEFHVSSVSFLGYIIEGGQVKTDPKKIQAVAAWPTPTSVKQLQRFLGFANFYRHFIRDYSRIAAPLTKLTSSAVRFSWTPEAEQAVMELKSHFTSAPVLIQPDSSRQFIAEVDASGLCSPSGLLRIRSSTLLLFSHIDYPPPSSTMTLETVGCWQLSCTES